MTKDGLARMEGKLARLKNALPELIAESQRTAAYGDRSDSAEYKEAKGALRRANWGILGLESQIRRAVIINTGPNISGRVELGSTVLLKIGEKEKLFQIVGSHETSPASGRISHKSPLGEALINHVKGDMVIIETPNGSKKYHILDIR